MIGDDCSENANVIGPGQVTGLVQNTLQTKQNKNEKTKNPVKGPLQMFDFKKNERAHTLYALLSSSNCFSLYFGFERIDDYYDYSMAGRIIVDCDQHQHHSMDDGDYDDNNNNKILSHFDITHTLSLLHSMGLGSVASSNAIITIIVI